jgi:molecular chaperone DnaK
MHPREQTMVNVEIEVSRNDFLTMIAAKLKGTLATVDQTLADANIKKEQIDDVLLVGGSTRIPKIRQMLEKHFGKAPRSDINPDECVALGAAMQGLRYVDTTKMTTEREQKVEAQLSQMGQVIDVTGHSLGVREGNSPIPATEEKLYVTASDFQTQVKVSVFQGEDSSVGKNTLLKEFEVQGLPPLPAGQVKIKIRFSLDLNGVLQVSCVDMVRNKEHTIEARYGGATTAKPSDLLSGPQPAGAPTPGAAAPAPTATLQRIPKSMHENWKRAEELLPTLPAVDREKLDRGMKEYLAALDAKDAAAIDDKGNALIDILFDVTPI